MKLCSNFVTKRENSFHEVKLFVEGILIKLYFKPTISGGESPIHKYAKQI